MSTPRCSTHDGDTSSPDGCPERRKSLGCSEVGATRRVIFPWLHSSPEEAWGNRKRASQPTRQMPASSSCSERPIRNYDAVDGGGRFRSLERSISFPKDGLGKQQDGDAIKLLPLPKSLDIPKQSQTFHAASSGEIGSRVNEKRGLPIRDSICVQKAILTNSSPIDKSHRASPLSNNKWLVQYHEPPNNAKAAPKPLTSILRNSCSASVGCASRRRSSILCRNTSPALLSPDGSIATSSPHDASRPSSKFPTLASPSSLRSLNSETGCTDKEEVQHDIGETESDLQRITIPTLKVINRKDNKLRRNASDTVVITNEEEQRQRRRRSIHADENNARGALNGLSDSLTSVESSVSRHQSLECLPIHKKISFDPHIWVYEYKDDKPEFERNGDGKWFTEDELAQFKEDAIQRIRQRNMKMISAGSGRVALVPVFTHPALGLEDEFDPDGCNSKEGLIRDALSREMRNVLVVDPHDAFLVLFTKCLKFIIPHVSVATARSGEEAVARIQAAQKAFPTSDGGAVHGFDIILLEERLHPCNNMLSMSSNAAKQSAGDDSIQRQRKLTSGSSLIHSIVDQEQDIRNRVRNAHPSQQLPIRFSLLIGVSAYLAEDKTRLEQSGADFVWGKPPPEMNSKLRNDILKVLMRKRKIDSSSLFD
ncbi:hypothetical protein HJC23_005428 [Cyclotella cryptica]|uniref:Response regulatory domain-containing protein n=1 Tax=Cyclotella cryptica TaxID=29204 RepID=A0ABD3NY57_9STRA